jgi:tRNA1(Val) A37 N6-methylase TrmN6
VNQANKEARRAALERELGETMTLDGLTREWTIFQRRRGHRHSTDDLLTAWYAVTRVAQATRLLDLGSGIGSVGLLTLWRFPQATLTAIEAQEISFRLLCENVAANQLGARVTTVHGDLRETTIDDAGFDLVTGSPPYFDVKDGIVPADSQKAHARFELRGGLEDYCRAAARALAPDGLLVAVWEAAQEARALAAGAPAGLVPLRLWPIVFRAGQAPLIVLVAYAAAGTTAAAPGPAPTPAREAPLLVRDAQGHRTAAMIAIRADMGMPAGKPRPGGLY